MSPQSLPPVDPTCPCPPRAAGSCCHDTPRELPRPGGSYPNSYGLRWLELPALPSTAHPRSERGSERLAKAPPWLFSAESDMAPLPYVTHAFRLQPSTASRDHHFGSNPRPPATFPPLLIASSPVPLLFGQVACAYGRYACGLERLGREPAAMGAHPLCMLRMAGLGWA